MTQNLLEFPRQSVGDSATPPSHPGRPLDPLLAGLWLGLVVGIVEGIGFVLQHVVLGRFVVKGPHGLWHSAVADIVLFGLAGVILKVVGSVRRKPVDVRITAFVMVFMAAVGLLTDTRLLHGAAIVVLSLGFAWQASRLAPRWPSAATLMRRSLAPMGVVIVAAVLGVFGLEMTREARAMNALPAPVKGTPNVILVVLDTVRAQNLSLYGHDRDTTSHLREHAANGVVFERAYATAPWTLPSHETLFTGRYPQEIGTGWYEFFSGQWPTLSEQFRNRGYATGGFVANVLFAGRQTGLARGFARYEDHRLVSPGLILRSCGVGKRLVNTARPVLPPALERFITDEKRAEEIVDGFLDWQEELDGRPFFAFLNIFDAHHPYDPPRPFDTRYSGIPTGRVVRDDRQHGFGEDELAQMEIAYDSEIAFVDQQLGRLFGALQERGLADNTIVVVTSDHGELFGEHGLIDHGNSLYAPVLHVPLTVVWPAGVPAGVRVVEPISLRDVAATIMDLTGQEGSPLPGVSLRAFWDRQAGPPVGSPILSYAARTTNVDWYPTHRGPLRSIVEGRFLYVCNAEGSEELYDLEADVAETTNLVSTVDGRAIADRLRATMDSSLPAASR
jgi:arylsulfatase A-like enzyme